MKRVGLVFLTVCLAGTAQADLTTTFTFDSLSEGAEAPAISTYMSDTYGSSVTVTQARVERNPVNAAGLPDWTGNDGSFIWTFGGGTVPSMDIYFNEVPITGMQFDGFVFDDTGPVDFQVIAYAGSTPVYSKTWDVGAGQMIFSGEIDFASQLVDHLWFSDSGKRDIGIDNLTVAAVPIPAAVLLGVLGLAAAGWRLRKLV